ncbi:hypothetical protein HanPI659440_Chr06g0229961 [Helianthus annuus]|nr:hypothetical protein HanPI659440_Chr06g0229961 [Helianthus annuus]
MEISLIPDTLSTIATKYNHKFLQISALIVPIDAIAPPTIKPRTAPKKLARKRCRIKRSSKTDGGDASVNENDFSGGFFDGGDGPFGGGSGGGGGGGGGGFGWDESVPEKLDPAFDFVYGVLCWIVFSNCLHFAFKRVIRRILGDGVSERQKVSVSLVI